MGKAALHSGARLTSWGTRGAGWEGGGGGGTEGSVTHDLPPIRRRCPWTPERILHPAGLTFLLLEAPATNRRVSRRLREEG